MGIVNIDDLQKRGIPGQTIENIIRNDVITLSTVAHAKEAMDAIQSQRADFVVVLKWQAKSGRYYHQGFNRSIIKHHVVG